MVGGMFACFIEFVSRSCAQVIGLCPIAHSNEQLPFAMDARLGVRLHYYSILKDEHWDMLMPKYWNLYIHTHFSPMIWRLQLTDPQLIVSHGCDQIVLRRSDMFLGGRILNIVQDWKDVCALLPIILDALPCDHICHWPCHHGVASQLSQSEYTEQSWFYPTRVFQSNVTHSHWVSTCHERTRQCTISHCVYRWYHHHHCMTNAGTDTYASHLHSDCCCVCVYVDNMPMCVCWDSAHCVVTIPWLFSCIGFMIIHL